MVGALKVLIDNDCGNNAKQSILKKKTVRAIFKAETHYLSHAIAVLVYEIKLGKLIRACSTNHHTLIAIGSLFSSIIYTQMTMAFDKLPSVFWPYYSST